MKRHDTQICLVSGQSVPNVTPAMDERLRPGKIVLCATNAMRKNATILQAFFSRKSVETEIFELGDAYDFKELKERFLVLASSFENQENVAVNLAGGTKLMTIAAQEVFGGDFDMFYVIPERDLIVMITDGESESYEIQDKIKIEDFFAIHGYKVTSIERKKNISGESRRLFEKLLPRMDEFAKPIGVLNALAHEAWRKRAMQIGNEIPESSWELLTIFQNHGAVDYYDDKKIIFKDDDGRAFCNGFWLEEYVYLELKKLGDETPLQDFAVSVEIENAHGVRNEIDAAFLHDNSLYLIECKTARMNEKGAEVVYKMDTISGYAGLYTKGILVSHRRLERHDNQRAKDLNITVIQGNEINNLKERLLPR
ncbi:MAG: DUF1887 family protein [Kiritimatiellaeota bacterium]|nr:DUF1887 family protein [Kiritimatiellota bacterium]